MTLRISAVAWLWLATLGLLAGCSPAGNAIEQDLPATPAPTASPPSEKPASPPSAELPPGHPAIAPATSDSKPGEVEIASGAEAGSHTISLGDKLTMTAPDSWIVKRPGNPMISQEFAIPAAKGDPRDGRMTVSSAGGSIGANLERWAGQFSQPDGSKTAGKMKVEKKTLAGLEVNLVDIFGTYQESAGMMQPAIERPDYRMLAAIIPGEGSNFFLKFYGPKKTVAEHEKEFRGMIEGLKAAK
jgi:hypothetical protein